MAGFPVWNMSPRQPADKLLPESYYTGFDFKRDTAGSGFARTECPDQTTTGINELGWVVSIAVKPDFVV